MATKKTEENKSLSEKMKIWWESDTAKAIATIIAVLLIPASVIAWNYATTRGEEIQNEIANNEEPENTEEATENDVDENQVTEENDSVEVEEDNVQPSEETIQNEQGQESAADNTEPENVGGLDSVQKLPNTDSDEYYTVRKGDNVYSVSMKVCGNDSYYTSNMRRNYLRVGEVLRVHCN